MFYKFIFYHFYLVVRFFKNHIKNHLFTGDLKFDSLLLFSVFEFLNIYSIDKYFEIFSPVTNFTFFFLLSILVLGGINYLYLIKGDKFEKVINNVKSKNTVYIIIGKIFTIFYAIATCYFFYTATRK
jgi:hypothetical protein